MMQPNTKPQSIGSLSKHLLTPRPRFPRQLQLFVAASQQSAANILNGGFLPKAATPTVAPAFASPTLALHRTS
jgi:hypothetical protein